MSTATATAPFGLPVDPRELKGKVHTSVQTVVSASSYLLSDKIFNCLPSTEESTLDLWASAGKKNLNNEVPALHNLEITTGAGNVLLGYMKNSSPSVAATVVATSDSLSHLAAALIGHGEQLPLSIQLASLEYDFGKGELVSNYSKALQAAKSLKLPVLTSTDALEAQYYAILSHVLATLNVANVHLFNGLTALRQFQTIQHVLSAEEVKSLSSKLTAALTCEITNLAPAQRITFALAKLNEITGTTKYDSFEFYGEKSSEEVYVVYSTEEKVVAPFKKINVSSPGAAAIVVKSPAAFDSVKFNSLIGSSVKKITVVAESVAKGAVSALKLDVQAALFFEGNFGVQVTEATELPEFIAIESNGATYRFILQDNSKFARVPAQLTHALSLAEKDVKFRPIFDNSIQGGLFQVDVTAGDDFTNLLDLVVVENATMLNNVDFFTTLKSNGTILVLNDAESAFDEQKLIDKTLSEETKRILATKKLNLEILDLNVVGEAEATQGRTGSIAIQSAFWAITNPDLVPHAVTTKILQAFGSEAELLASVIADQIETTKANAFKKVSFDEKWIEGEAEQTEEDGDKAYATLRDTAFVGNPREAFVDNLNVQVDKDALAKKLMFKEAYGTTTALRPDLPVENFVVKVKENKRLTPDNYSRNIFHIEFDVRGTGLTYNIGEALGVHGRNNAEMVDEFIQMYGLDADSLVEVSSKEDHHIFEVRTLRQSLIENIDLFGKPGKRFYEALVDFAEGDEKKKLEELVSPAGAELFKKFQDEEFYTFADVFELFKTVRPSAQDLVQIVPALKRREYSIASSQKLHPNEVHLLVVVVDWVDAKGRTRYGQCSKYLSDLAVGQELVVSVKPSIMKLPPLTTQPIVMAGLGTGLAPFKAFIEERQYQLEQGAEIGEIYLYLGSRHKREEYLYGEYWEAYMDADVLTHLGAAFSRDQPEKVYIQDKIRENLDELRDLITEKNGHFYLCGPTWPVPDISACLQDILEADAKSKGIEIDSAQAVEDMKEEGRYVLEVY